MRLPKLGEGAESGTVVSLHVKEGDTVTKGQTLLELENEKAVAPIPSTVAGTVAKLRVKEGDTVSVGQVIATINESDGPAAPEVPAAPKKLAPARAAEPEPAPEEEEPVEDESQEVSDAAVAAAPSIRKIARELGISLGKIRGSERGGRIVMADLRAYIQRLQKLTAGRAAPSAPPPQRIDFSKWGEVTKKPLSPLRKTIGRRMIESWNAIPHVTQFDEADITGLMELRKKHGAAYEGKGAKLTLTPLVIKAVIAALKKHPVFNASIDEAADELVFKEYYHIGVAVDTEHGLFVPVIRNADRKSLFELSKEVNELAEKARDRKLGLEEMQGGTLTISNQGGIGGGHFTPIVNRPEVAILGLGRGVMKAVVKEKKIETRLLMPVCVSYDHRVIDGGSAARFVVDLIQAIENFNEEDVRL
ncbi:MAG: 2-oxo acid dehydrogenase subunit E2 [Verrucomicrobia subdivision 3 bacterium]|nr:2-oxo acid dehydrogenase subunit E2 [Limisphaerales bacterium]